MQFDIVAILVLVISCAITFTIARVLGRNFRAKRRDKQIAESRKNESRQVRRARERRGR